MIVLIYMKYFQLGFINSCLKYLKLDQLTMNPPLQFIDPISLLFLYTLLTHVKLALYS